MSRGQKDADQIDTRSGRPPRSPFSQVGDWVMLAPIRHPAARLYWALSAHLNAKRGTAEVWPTKDSLAAMLGYSEGKKIGTYVDELVRLGAIDVDRVSIPGGGYRKRTIYTIHSSPPEGFEGLGSLTAFYARLKAERAKSKAALTSADEF